MSYLDKAAHLQSSFFFVVQHPSGSPPTAYQYLWNITLIPKARTQEGYNSWPNGTTGRMKQFWGRHRMQPRKSESEIEMSHCVRNYAIGWAAIIGGFRFGKTCFIYYIFKDNFHCKFLFSMRTLANVEVEKEKCFHNSEYQSVELWFITYEVEWSVSIFCWIPSIKLLPKFGC